MRLSRSPPNDHSALPMPGPYYVDANLIHCRVHPYGEQIPGSLLKNKFGLPLEPDLNVRFTPSAHLKTSMSNTYRRLLVVLTVV